MDRRLSAVESKLDHLIGLLSQPGSSSKRRRTVSANAVTPSPALTRPVPGSAAVSPRNLYTHSESLEDEYSACSSNLTSMPKDPPLDIPENVGSMHPKDAFTLWHTDRWMDIKPNSMNKSRMNICRMGMAYFLLFLQRPIPRLPDGVVNTDDTSKEARKWRKEFKSIVAEAWENIEEFFALQGFDNAYICTVNKFKEAMFARVNYTEWPNGLASEHINDYKLFYKEGNKNVPKTRQELLLNKLTSNRKKQKAAQKRQEEEQAAVTAEARAAVITQDEQQEQQALEEEHQQANSNSTDNSMTE